MSASLGIYIVTNTNIYQMKKVIVSSLLLCSLSTLSYSQQDSVLRNKNGRVILPEQGDVAIGIGANSIFNYVGNMFSSAGKNKLELNLLNNNYLYGKYFINEKMQSVQSLA